MISSSNAFDYVTQRFDIDIDERYPPPAVHPAKCVRHRTNSFANSIRITRSAKSQALVCCQGTAAEYANPPGQPQSFANQER